MKLFLEKKNQRFNPEVYTKTSDIDYTTSSDGFLIDVTVNGSNTPQIFTFENEIPCEIGEQCVISAKIIPFSVFGSFEVKVFHDGSSIGDLNMTNEISFEKQNETIEIRFESSGFASLKLSNLSLTKVGYNEVDVLSFEEVKLTKQVKDFGNISDVKAGFTNNIVIKNTQKNIDVIGYFSNISSNNINAIPYGIMAILTTDSGEIMEDGKIIIKEIKRIGNDIYLYLFFSTFDTSFFNYLDTKELSLRHQYIPNTQSSKYINIMKSLNDIESDEDYYLFSHVNNDFHFSFDDISNFPVCEGAFNYDIQHYNGNSISSYDTKTNSKVPFEGVVFGHLTEMIPVFRVKELIKDIHKKYGYDVEGEIFDDPKFFNLVITPVKKEYKLSEDNNIDELMFSGSIDVDGHNNMIFLTPTTTDVANYDVLSNNNWMGENYYIENYFMNDQYKKLYGHPTRIGNNHGIQWKHNFDTKMKLKITISIDKSALGTSGIFRIGISDTYQVGYKTKMNPHSFFVIEDIVVKDDSTGISIIEKEITVDKVRMIRQNDIHFYGIKVFIIGDELNGASANPITCNFSVSLSDLNKDKIAVNNNSYYIDDVWFLDTSELDFMKDLITKFNLIPIVDTINHKIIYKTFDEFYLTNNDIDFNDKIMRDKEIVYDFYSKDMKSKYIFRNNTQASNEDFDDRPEYGEKTVNTNILNRGDYIIDNKIENMYFDLQGKEIYGKYDKTKDKLGGFPLKGNLDTNLYDYDISLDDYTEIDSDRTIWNKEKMKTSVLGYVKEFIGKDHYFNNLHKFGFPITDSNGFRHYSTYKDCGSKISPSTFDPDVTNIRFVGPNNQINYYEKTNELLYNFSVYNTLNYDLFSDNYTNITQYAFFDLEMKNFNLLNNHTLTSYMILSESEYVILNMREKLIIDGNRYLIKKISNFSPKKPTKIELQSFGFNPGWRKIYESDEKFILESPQPVGMRDNMFQNVNFMGDFLIGVATNHHLVGKKYKVSFKIRTNDDSELVRVYKGGSTGTNAMNLNINIPAYTTIPIEYEYIREEGTNNMASEKELWYFNPSTSFIQHTITDMVIYEEL